MRAIEVKNYSRDFKVAKNTGHFFRDFFKNDHEIKKAVDNVSFSVEPGEIVGYIGPNGAGKSTTIKTLTGILVPTSGIVTVNGLVPYKQRKEHARNIGVVFGQRSQLWWELPVIDSFILLKNIYKIPDETYEKNLKRFNDILELDTLLNKPVRQLSLGQRVRADFAAALLHSPKTIFLDEPTIGLDIFAKENIRRFILDINKNEGTTIVLTSHDVTDIETLCSRTIVIDKGSVVYDGSLTSMKLKYGQYRTIVVDFVGKIDVLDVPNAEVVHSEGTKRFIKFHKDICSPAQIISELLKEHEIKDFTIQETGIEDIIKAIYMGK